MCSRMMPCREIGEIKVVLFLEEEICSMYSIDEDVKC